MKTIRLSLTGSDGPPCEVPYTLPQSVRFDCFVPEAGICRAFVDISAEEVVVDELLQPGLNGAWYMLSLTELDDRLTRDVLEQAGDVCAVFERALSAPARTLAAGWEQKGITPDTASDAKTLTTIADLARHEQALRYAWGCIPPALRTGNYVPEMLVAQVLEDTETPNMDCRAVRVLHAFIHKHLVERAQSMATKAARARQQAWEAQQGCLPCGGSGEGVGPEGVCGRCQPMVRP